MIEYSSGRFHRQKNLLIQAHAASGNLEEALEVFKSIRRPNVYTWNIMLGAFAAGGKEEQAEALFRKIPSPSPATWNTMMNMYAGNGHLQKALDLFAVMPCRDPISWTTMLLALLEKNQIDSAVDLYWRMPDKNLVAQTALLAAYALNGNVSEAVVVFESMAFVDSASCNSMLRAFGNSLKAEKAKRMFDAMPLYDTASWNALMAAYAAIGDNISALRLFSEMPVWNSASCNELVLCLKQNEGLLEEAENLLSFIPQQEVLFSLRSSLLAAHVQAGRYDAAVKIAEKLPKLDLSSSTSLITAYSRDGRLEDARGVFHSMLEQDIVSLNAMLAAFLRNDTHLHRAKCFYARKMPCRNSVTWSMMLRGYGARKRVEELLLLITDIPEWDTGSWRSMISAYLENDEIKQARLAFESFEGSYQDIEAATLLLRWYIASGLLQEALRLFYQLHFHDLPSSNTLLLGLIRNGFVKEGIKFHQQQPHRDEISWTTIAEVMPELFFTAPEHSTVSWSGFISATFAQQRELRVVENISLMQVSGFSPDKLCLLLVLGILSHSGELHQSRSLFRSIIYDHGCTPSLEHYQCMVCALGRAGKSNSALELLEYMPFYPDSVAWTSLRSCYDLIQI